MPHNTFSFLQATYNEHAIKSETDRDLIYRHHQYITIPKGEYFLQEGQTANAYLILTSGLARAYVLDYESEEITTNFFSPGQIAIEVLSLFTRTPSKENIIAITEVKGWLIDFNTFQELFHQIPDLREWGRSWMANQLFESKLRSVEMITENATTRYIKLMEQQPDIIAHAPLKQIASYLGITDTSLSRIRKELISKL